MRVAHCNVERIRTLFDNFSKEVADRKFKKLDYKTWKEMRKVLDNSKFPINDKIDARYNPNDNYLTLESKEDYNPGTFWLNTKDDSFGSYLFQHLALREEVEAVAPKTQTFSAAALEKLVDQVKVPDRDNLYSWRVNSYDIPAYGGKVARISDFDGVPIYNDTAIASKVADTFGSSTKEYIDKAVAEALTDAIIKNDEAACCENTENKKENKNMINFNFDFGRVESDKVRMSPYGLAVKNSNGTYVSYNAGTGEITDVDIFNFDGSQFMYKIPVALKDVQSGDVIIHNHKPMFVSKVEAVNLLTVVDIYNGERKDVIPTTNMFGFNFVTKVVSLINMGTPTNDNPFGNILPFMLMADKGKGDNQDMLMAMMFMNQGTGMGGNAMFQNPLMLMALMDNDGKDNDMFKMLMLSQMMTPQTQAQPATPFGNVAPAVNTAPNPVG